MTVLAPDAGKAATLDGQELVYASFPIEKWEDGPDGSVYVYGKATTPEVDTDDQVVDSSWSGAALKSWMDTGPNLRVMHNSQRDPAGSGVKVEINRDGDGAHWVKSIVDEPVAVRLVKGGHLRAYSVGIAKPVIERDMTGKARGGIIRGGSLAELSLVDRPANVSCSLSLVKAAKDGHAEFPGVLAATEEILAKAADPVVTKVAGDKGVTVTLPKSLRVSVSPKDLAKLATFKQQLVTKGAAPAATKAPDPLAEYQAASNEIHYAEEDALKAIGAAEDAILGKGSRTFSAEERRGYASSETALPDGSYPMPDADAVRRAAILIRSKHGNWKAAARLLARRAKALKIPNPLKKKPKADKAAEPAVAKCACSGGMMDGKPCTMCKAGKRMARKQVKAAEPAAEKGKGKLRALCPGCGAKQNKEHVHCTECGQQLPPMPPMVAKNHDFMCLGCGKDLDKGEKHCPGCGKENPGYNPMADMKIPANEAVKARKDRVAKKARKKGKSGKEPFGGQQAMPFGKDKDEAADGPEPKKDAKKAAAAAKGMKPGKGKKPKAGHKPTPAEAGGVPGQHDKPAPRHREPDGAEIENFERDAHLEDGDNEKPTHLESPTLKSGDPEAAAALTLKNLDVPQHLGALHALTCPAYHPDDVAKAFPHASFAAIDLPEWHAGALEKAASAPLDEAQGAMETYNAAVTLKGADPFMLADLRTAAYKAFRDANPGPGSFPEPGQISPARFSRPYISDGHGAASPGYRGPHHAKLPEEGGVASTDYNRPYLDAGHAAESPGNQHTPGPMQPPSRTGVPTSEPARGFMSSNGIASMQHSMAAMHDHISRRFPDVCPMEASLHIGSNPVPVPHGVPQPGKAPGARKAAKAAKRAKVKARKAAKVKAQKIAAKRRKVERRVLKGAMSVADARVKLGMEPLDPSAPPESPMSKGAAAPLVASIDPEALKAALTEATAPLVARLGKARKTAARQDKALRKLRKTTDAIASQPDTSQSPMRMAALTKTTASAAPAGPQTATASAEQAQVTKMQLLQHEWRNSPDPSQREAAYAELTKMLGVNSMTPPSPVTIPMRT